MNLLPIGYMKNGSKWVFPHVKSLTILKTLRIVLSAPYVAVYTYDHWTGKFCHQVRPLRLKQGSTRDNAFIQEIPLRWLTGGKLNKTFYNSEL